MVETLPSLGLRDLILQRTPSLKSRRPPHRCRSLGESRRFATDLSILARERFAP